MGCSQVSRAGQTLFMLGNFSLGRPVFPVLQLAILCTENTVGPVWPCSVGYLHTIPVQVGEMPPDSLFTTAKGPLWAPTSQRRGAALPQLPRPLSPFRILMRGPISNPEANEPVGGVCSVCMSACICVSVCVYMFACVSVYMCLYVFMCAYV